MKTIDIKSLLIGAIAASSIIVLTSSNYQTEDNNNIQFVASAAGTGIYNSQTKTLYMYKMWNANLNPKPHEVFKVAADGSYLTAIK